MANNASKKVSFAQSSASQQVVSCYNEWDPLEEVIVGTLEGAAVLPWEPSLAAVVHNAHKELAKEFFIKNAGKPVPKDTQTPAQKELDEFIHILEAEGVTVRRPEPLDHTKSFSTPHWKSVGGNCQANPRDVLIVFGNEILEAPMSWHSRYFEFLAYRKLCKEYFKQGAVWTAAPKPQMTEELYNQNFISGKEYILTEFEPVFDVADIARLGKDVFVQKSQTTNDFGIEWLTRHLGNTYRVHTVEFEDDRAMHIDATFVPLAPGKVLVNPDRPIKDPSYFKKHGWEFLEAPRTTLAKSTKYFEAYRWLSMNVLSLDEKRIIVEKNEEPLMKALRDWGLEPIPCPFRENYYYGGSFHCSTVDIRRRGALESYF